MSALLTPLPSPSPGLAARIVSPPIWKALPSSFSVDKAPSRPALAAMPAWQGNSETVAPVFPIQRASPLSALPAPIASAVAIAPFPCGIGNAVETKSEPYFIPPQIIQPARIIEEPRLAADPRPDFTDDDLREAFGPIVEQAVRGAVYAKENGIDTYLEPMLRATMRRALAEYSPGSRPFQAPAVTDRFFWHLQALFTSRTYEDILFEKTRRFQVEEVFLVDTASLALVSFASCDPARHASAKRVTSTVQRLAMQLRDDQGKIRESFDLPDRRKVISRGGRFVILLAIIHGRPSELVLADLEFALRRIEDHFREQFKNVASELLFPLQPFLEDCLLIQAPASAA